jgi:hypothetical protein
MAGIRRKLERALEQRDSARRRLAETQRLLAAAEALIERIECQAVCVGMDGDDGNGQMLMNILNWIKQRAASKAPGSRWSIQSVKRPEETGA